MALSDKNKQTLLVGGILGGAILIIIAYFALLYVRPGVKESNETVERLEQQIKRQSARLQDLEAQMANTEKQRQLQQQFRQIERRLPSDQDPIEIFDLLRGYFEGSDVAFTYIEPGQRVDRGRFSEFPFIIRGSARYHEFGQLVNLIECNPDRLMHVSTFKLTNNPRRPSIHPMEVGIATFTFNE